eukprot:2066604-Pleurochrysis_carterae.AAC.2
MANRMKGCDSYPFEYVQNRLSGYSGSFSACKWSAAVCLYVVESPIHSVFDTKPRSTLRADAQRLVAPRP